MAERLESPFAQRPEALRLLAALAGVGLAADAVHGDRQSLVRLARDRAEAHGAGGEPLHDLGGRLHLLKRNGRASELFCALQPEEAADGEVPLHLAVHVRGILPVGLDAPAAHRVLEEGDRLGRPDMILAAQAIGIFAADIERAAQHGILAEGSLVTPQRLVGDLGQADPLDGARRAEEEAMHEIA